MPTFIKRCGLKNQFEQRCSRHGIKRDIVHKSCPLWVCPGMRPPTKDIEEGAISIVSVTSPDGSCITESALEAKKQMQQPSCESHESTNDPPPGYNKSRNEGLQSALVKIHMAPLESKSQESPVPCVSKSMKTLQLPSIRLHV